MKKIKIVLSFILCLTSIGTQAQKTLNPTNAKINLEELRFKGNNSSVFKIGDSPTQMQAALGAPTSEEDYYYEMQEVMAKLYKYGINKMYFVTEQFDAWEIFNQNISIGRNGKYFKVGDTVDKIYGAFPEYSNKPVQNGYIDIHLRSVDYDMECTRLIISFDSSGKISQIMRHDC
jgi:hypothetical protein